MRGDSSYSRLAAILINGAEFARDLITFPIAIACTAQGFTGTSPGGGATLVYYMSLILSVIHLIPGIVWGIRGGAFTSWNNLSDFIFDSWLSLSIFSGL